MGFQALDNKLPGYVLLITLSVFCSHSHRHRRVSESTYKFRIHKSYNFFKGAIIRQRFFSLFGLLADRKWIRGWERPWGATKFPPAGGWTKDTATEMSWDVNFLIIRLITSPPLMFMSEQETQNVLLLLTTWLVGQFLHPRHHREKQKNWKTGIINNLSTTCLLYLQSRPVAWMLWSASHQQG